MFDQLRANGQVARPRPVEWALRVLVLLFCVLVSVVLGYAPAALLWALALLVVAGLTSRLRPAGVTARALRLVEAALGVLAVLGTGVEQSPFLIYVIVPTVAAGLWSSVLDALLATAVSVVMLVVVGVVAGEIGEVQYTLRVAQYVLIALILGPLAAWARRALQPKPTDDQPLYDAAYRLLSQLRTVTRQLPGTLDPLVVTSELLDRAAAVVPADRSGVLVRGGDGKLTPVAGSRDELVLDDIGLTGDTPYVDAWTTQVAQTSRRGPDGWQLVVPMVVGVRTCGLLICEGSDSAAPQADQLAQLTEVATASALRLETALLFDDVRDLATAEERQRVAREIHDGIAQELVIVGYGIDNALADLPPGSTESRTTLTVLRGEVTRIITELRLSLFDLRADIDPHGGLGASISAYLRGVGTTSGLTVHITLDESPQRLPSGTEVELLRIVQEAVTNARKHSGAANLWVTCDVHPPVALVRVEDDGRGMVGSGRQDSFGLKTMRERAQRLHASLDVRSRSAGGTVVEVHLDGVSSTRTVGRSTVIPSKGRP